MKITRAYMAGSGRAVYRAEHGDIVRYGDTRMQAIIGVLYLLDIKLK